jgi:nucleoside-diphosphate-sugar epimerase
MHILITGAAGFIGQLLAEELLKDASHTVVLADIVTPPIPKGARHQQNAKSIKADLCENVGAVIDNKLDAVFAFHGIMSSGSEANFDLGMKVNIDATRNLLEALRRTCLGIRFIYSSSQAVYGMPTPKVVTDASIPTPQSSYGAEKLICETLVNEYSRRGFLDGITLRFPTITVRPGVPTAAASSFVSGIIREPLNGIECEIPIEDRRFESWISSPRNLVANLLHALTLPSTKLAPHIRTINMPGICVTIQDMMDALEKVGGKEKLSLVKEKSDPALLPILHSWPARFDNQQAIGFGFQRDTSFEQAVRDYQASLSAAH